MHPHTHLAALVVDLERLDAGVDLLPLLFPIAAHAGAAADASAGHGVRPVDLGREVLDRRLDVALVEGAIHLGDDLFPVDGHRASLQRMDSPRVGRTPSHPPPSRGRGREGTVSASLSKPVLPCRCILRPLPLKGGGWEGVKRRAIGDGARFTRRSPPSRPRRGRARRRPRSPIPWRCSRLRCGRGRRRRGTSPSPSARRG